MATRFLMTCRNVGYSIVAPQPDYRGGKMKAENSLWGSHVILVTLTACAFAAVPFSMRGLSIEVTELAATIVFSSTIAAYILVMKLCGVQRQLSPTRNKP
jgi:hypothetical protein